VVATEKMKPNKSTAGVVLQYPNTTGSVEDYRELCEKVHKAGGLVIVATDLLALTLLTPPGEWGADVAVGNSQRFGVPYGYGGPHAAFFATKDDYKRQIPGRIIGVSRDSSGKPALRMALQTREQHIRREKATSNVCTAQVLLAVIAGMYAVWHGPEGLKRIARRVHQRAALFAAGVRQLGLAPQEGVFFDTVTVPVGGARGKIVKAAGKLGLNVRVVDRKTLSVAMGENTTVQDVSDLLTAFNAGTAHGFDLESLASTVSMDFGPTFERRSEFLSHPVFSRYHSETEMLRYMRKLESRDLSLTHSMIRGDGAGDVAEGGRDPSLCAGGAGQGICVDVRAVGEGVGRDHRVRRGLAAAECRLAGRVRGAVGDSRVSPGAGAGAPDDLSHSAVGARDQSGVGGDGGDAGRGRPHRRARQHRRGRPAPEGDAVLQ
jgi:hypothetical protein